MPLGNIVIKIFVFLLAIYIIFGILLFFFQKSFIYYPNNQNFEECDGFKDYKKLSFNKTRFYFKDNSKEKVIVYYHGNAGSACDRSRVKDVFEQSKSSLIFVEYAGYSNDQKKPSRDLILKDVENIHTFIKEKDYNKVIIYGQSIGSGAASYHAYLGNVDNLILVTPFSRLSDVVRANYGIYPISIMLREEYDNVKWLRDYHGSLVIIHGDSDRIILPRFSQNLFDEILLENKEYILIEDVGHNDIWLSSEFKKVLRKYISN